MVRSLAPAVVVVVIMVLSSVLLMSSLRLWLAGAADLVVVIVRP